jgi:hypothetical protein
LQIGSLDLKCQPSVPEGALQRVGATASPEAVP